MMCTLSRNCYVLQYTHTMLLLKRFQNQPLTPRNSRTGCPIEAEVCFLYRAHRAVSYISNIDQFLFLCPISPKMSIIVFKAKKKWTSGDLQMTFKMFSNNCLLHVLSFM